MAANKENVHANGPSRIPVLKDRNNNHPGKSDEVSQNTLHTRDPLKTLSNKNLENVTAGPSHKHPKKLDTRFVTQRKNVEELDWNFDVFKDNLNKTVFKHGIKDDLYRELESFQASSSSDGTLKVMPTFNSQTPPVLETFKKVKKSLTRSHCRNIESSGSIKDCNDCAIHSNINIKEPLVCANTNSYSVHNHVYDLDNLGHLIEIEKKVLGIPKLRKASRSCVINWIINVNGSSGNSAIVQLASWYLDNYLSVSLVTVNRLQVVAAACFWVACKMDGGRGVSGRRLVKYADNAFSEKDLVAAERNVLRKLKFQTMPVVPNDFVPYLSCWCDQSESGVVEAAATFLCQCGIMVDKLLNEEYPSVIAAAAVISALILLRKNAWIDKLKTCPIYKTIESKADNLKDTSAKLREAVRVVSAVGYEYKAPLCKFSCPPHYISSKIVKAVHYKDIISFDNKAYNICERKGPKET